MYLGADKYLRIGERQGQYLDLVIAVSTLFNKKPKKAVEEYIEALADQATGG